jgi:uncharacterized membrane protein YqjE
MWAQLLAAGVILAVVVLIVLALVCAVWLRRDAVRDERARQAARKAEADARTRKEIADAIEDSRASGSDWRKRLRNRRQP